MGDLGRFQHPRFARTYLRLSAASERRGTREHRQRLLGGLSGRVVEIGAGNGLNFPYYPDSVTEVVAVEPDESLRGVAERAAEGASVPVRVVAAHADGLPYDPATFDAAVVSLVLCSVPEPERSLAELKRVLRPGGEIRFFEHVRSENPIVGLAQGLVSPLWALGGGGCHLNRDTVASIRRVGFEVEELDRFSYRPLPKLPPSPHVLGRARVPA